MRLVSHIVRDGVGDVWPCMNDPHACFVGEGGKLGFRIRFVPRSKREFSIVGITDLIKKLINNSSFRLSADLLGAPRILAARGPSSVMWMTGHSVSRHAPKENRALRVVRRLLPIVKFMVVPKDSVLQHGRLMTCELPRGTGR